MRWPIRCLKRYGYSEGVFSFELGRRCPTGAGVYAFKCERAEALFQLLQVGPRTAGWRHCGTSSMVNISTSCNHGMTAGIASLASAFYVMTVDYVKCR